MRRSVMWASLEDGGLQHLDLSTSGEGVRARAVVIGISDGTPFSVSFELRCDPSWRVRELEVSPLLGAGESLRISSDGEGNWTGSEGESLPDLSGCTDVDITATPFTNTLPIRRLNLEPGGSEEIRVAYIHVPAMKAEPALQRYTRLDEDSYRFESLDGEFVGFTADLPVDRDGLVLDYPGLFERVGS